MFNIYKVIILIIILIINKYSKPILLNFIKFYSLKKIRKFLDKCLLNINNNQNFMIPYIIPKVTVIIPIFNCNNTIKSSINSIQNQKLKDLEIILINDFSKDNSKLIIENIKKLDSRIFIINNNKNMGTLYSRNIGVLAAKGKFIFALDNDDMFLDENLFYRLYKEAEKNKYDIIGFKTIIGYDYFSNIYEMYDEPFIKNKNKFVVYQPKLSLYSLNNNDCHIWGKCIKNEIYKKAVNMLGKKRYSIYLCYAEDDIMIFLLFKISKSFKFINKYGLFHLKSNKTASFYFSRNNRNHIAFSKLYFLNFLLDFTDNNFESKKYVISNAIIFYDKFFSKILLNKENQQYLNKVLYKILNCNFISNDDKEKLKYHYRNIK